MIKGNWVDHLYKYIEIDSETLKFINSTSIRDKVSRLSGLSQLGLTSKVFPSAVHTKLEHNLGVYFLANYLSDCGCCPKQIIKPLSFKIAAMIHGIGHFPFCLSTEVAFQKISFLNKTTEDFINQRIEPVIDRITKGIGERKRDRFRKQIIKERGRINHFYRFFTASFLLDNETTLRQAFDNSESGFNFDELLKYLSFPENVGFRLLSHIDKLDYVLRDTFHLGLIKVDLNLNPYFRDLKVSTDGEIQFPSEWDVLKEIESYAIRKIYNDPRVKIVEAVYEKLLMKMILDSEIALADFLDWQDEELKRKMRTYQKEGSHKYKLFEQIDKVKEEFNDLPRYYFSRRNNVFSPKRLLLTEGRSKTIGKALLREIDKSIENGIFRGSYFASFSDNPDICVNLVSLNKSQIDPFLREVGLYEKYYKKTSKDQIAQCVWGNHFSKIDFDRYDVVVEKLFAELRQKKQLTKEKINYQIVNQFLPQLRSEEAVPQEILQMVMDMIGISRKIIFLRNPEDKLFNEDFLKNLHFHSREAVLSFVKTLCKKRVRTIEDFRGRAFEYFMYLKKACEPLKRNDQIKKWVFPSTIITGRGDLDVSTLYVFKNRRPLIELVECSITTSPIKKLDATNKLNQKKEILQERFGTKVEVKIFFNDKELDE